MVFDGYERNFVAGPITLGILAIETGNQEGEKDDAGNSSVTTAAHG